MSRTETALNPLVENKSSAADRMASRMFGLRGAASSLSGRWGILISTNVQIIRSSQRISSSDPPRPRADRLPKRTWPALDAPQRLDWLVNQFLIAEVRCGHARAQI